MIHKTSGRFDHLLAGWLPDGNDWLIDSGASHHVTKRFDCHEHFKQHFSMDCAKEGDVLDSNAWKECNEIRFEKHMMKKSN